MEKKWWVEGLGDVGPDHSCWMQLAKIELSNPAQGQKKEVTKDQLQSGELAFATFQSGAGKTVCKMWRIE